MLLLITTNITLIFLWVGKVSGGILTELRASRIFIAFITAIWDLKFFLFIGSLFTAPIEYEVNDRLSALGA